MAELTLEQLRAELAPIRAQVDGLPLFGRKLSVIEQEMRMLKAAFNDFAKTNVTIGEIDALHEDVNRVMSQQLELETRIITLERLISSIK